MLRTNTGKKTQVFTRETVALVMAAVILYLSWGADRIQHVPGEEPENTQERTLDKSPEKRIIGYVFGARSPDVENIRADMLTHINYAFANVIDHQAVLMHDVDTEMLRQLQALKQVNPDLKILLSVGGWTWSGNFSDAALTDESRRTFARSALDLVREQKLDGIDLDWEYPGQIGAGNVFRPEDKKNFTLLLRTVREKLDELSDMEGRQGRDRYKLTIATGANQAYLDNTEMHKAHRYLDFVNIMTYDFHGSWTETTGHHANMYPSAGQEDRPSALDAVRRHVEAGVPTEKLVLGAAFYARGWTGVAPENNGLHQPYVSDVPNVPFSVLRGQYLNQNGYVRLWDDEAHAPWLWNAEIRTLYSYEDEESLREKALFVLSEGLSGVMYWEHSHDPDHFLLGAIYETLHRLE